MPTTLDDRQLLRDSVRGLLQDRSPEEEVRRLMDTPEGLDEGTWSALAELGALGLAVPEKYGGAGYGMVELGVVLEEGGRALLCAPLVSSILLAAQVLIESRDAEACGDYLPDLAGGERRASLALLEPGARWGDGSVQTLAEPDGGEWRLTGAKVCVLDGHTCDLLLVSARMTAGVSIFAVERGAAGVDAVAVPTIDQTRKQARIRLDRARGRLVGEAGQGSSIIERALDVAACGLAAEHAGGMRRAMESAVEYAKVRRQFGRAIGSFQAVKHLCAQMLLRTESASAAAEYALRTVDDAPDELPVVASVVAAYCPEAYVRVAEASIQIHGGIGFTWEHSAHLYFKRAKMSQLLFGPPEYHREQLAARVGITSGEFS